MNITILIIEDNPGDQLLLKEDLSSTQLNISDIITVATLAGASSLLKQRTFSLIFLDLFLPDSNGLDSFNELVKVNSKIPVIIFSGLADTQISLKAISLGAQDFLIKGEYTGNLLEKAIRYSMERKKNLEIIEGNNERYATISKATNDIIWDWDIQTNKVLWTGIGLMNYLPPESVSDDVPKNFWINKLHKDEVKSVTKSLLRSIVSGADAWEIDHRFLKNNGSYAHMHSRGYILRNATNQTVRMIGSMQDITERKIAEQKVLLSEQRFKSLVQNGADLLSIMDARADYLYVSPTSKKILGYNPEFLVGKNAFSFIHPEDLPPLLTAMEMIKTVKFVEPPFFRYKNAAGNWRWIESSITNLMDDPAIEGIVVNSRDITEKKLAEESVALERSYRQKEITEAVIAAQENERTEIGRELHDNVNQLLGATRLYIDMARRDADKRDELLESSSIYTLSAIEEIRKLSKTLITPLLNDIGLTDAVKELAEDIMQVHPVKIEFDSTGFTNEIFNHKFQLNIFRIIQEQLNNALKHASATLVNINIKQTSDKLILSISDDGIGFDATRRRKGVGITNINSRAELYKGDVSLDSAPGKGCLLSIDFVISKLLLN